MEDLKNNLETLGFSPNESKVFMVLMKGKTQTAAEIAEEAGIPRPSVYEILKSFTEKGFCNEIETPSKLWYEIIDPDVVEDKIERELNNTYKTKISNLKGSFGKFKSLYKADEEQNNHLNIELLRGFNKHRHLKFLELMKEATSELLLMNRFEGRVFAEQDEVGRNFVNNGGVMKTIYEISTDFKIKVEDKWVQVDKESLVKLCEKFEEEGAQVRLIDSVPQNFAVFDKKTVFLNVVEDNTSNSSKDDILIRNHRYAKLMSDAFNFYWEKSKTVEEYKNSL